MDRFGEYLDPGYQRHYSRLCNLLLKRGKISTDLRELTIAALKSDEEKEEFFREYEMTEHLISFYVDRRRYPEACSVAVANGDVDKAWELSDQYGGMERLPQKQRIEVYNYGQAQFLHNTLDPASEYVFIPNAGWATYRSWLSDLPATQEFWQRLPGLLSRLLRHDITYDSIDYSQRWMKQLFDIIVWPPAASPCRASLTETGNIQGSSIYQICKVGGRTSS